MNIKNSKWFLYGLLLLSFAVHIGCGKRDRIREVYSTNLKKLHGCYMLYLEEHGYKGPETEEEFKDYLKTNPTAIHLLKRIDVTPEIVDEIFISDRDGEPFIVRYGVKGVADHAVVLESVGLEGKRLVALAEPIEVDDDEHAKYLSGEIKPETEQGFGMEGGDDDSGDGESE